MQHHPFTHLCASVASGIVTCTIGSPLWVVKTRMQLQTCNQTGYTHAANCLVRIVREEGVGALFCGLTASYWGISEMAVQFLVYEQLKQLATDSFANNSTTDHTATTNHNNISQTPPTLITTTSAASNLSNESRGPSSIVLFGAAAVAKLLAIFATYPHEVVRTRVREREWPHNVQGFISSLVHIGRTDGWHALYAGMGVHVMRSVPNAGVMFVAYEYVCRLYLSRCSNKT
eukprot:c14329_g1_i1.p1 GENE.c14329_g1_i1~~c14329_g1_i1.p1  ORF type:complete len:231 (+),score=62.22 c14329_g1_i1:129-821(+)